MQLKLAKWTLNITGDRSTDVFWIHGGLGCGKTFSIVLKHYQWILENIDCGRSWFIEPAYHKVDSIAIPAWRTLFDIYKLREGKHYRFLQSKPQKLEIYNGLSTHTVLFQSADRPQMMVGDNIGYFTLDEAGEAKSTVFERAGDRARDKSARYIQKTIAGVPQGLNWFADFADWRGYNAEKNEKSFEVHTESNRDNLHPRYIEQQVARYGHNRGKLDSFLYGRFTNFFEGQAYPDYDAENDRHELEPDASLPIRMTWDFNVQPLAWVVLQRRRFEDDNKVEHKYCTQGESSGRSQLIIDACAEFIAMYDPRKYKHTPIRVNGDCNGHQRSTRAKGSCYDDIKSYLKQYYSNVEIVAPKVNPGVQVRVEAVNKAFSYGRALVHKNDKNTSRSLSRTSWKAGTNDIAKPSGDDWTHWGDAFGYDLFDAFKDERWLNVDLPTIF